MKLSFCLFVLAPLLWTAPLPAAEATYPGKDVFTQGQARLPKTIVLVNSEGKETPYTTAELKPDFVMYDDANFSMGMTTRCDPYIGQTKENIDIPLNITARGLGSGRTVQAVKPLGAAVLTIPAGTNAYGRCGEKATSLVALTLQVTEPSSGNNAFDRAFPLKF